MPPADLSPLTTPELPPPFLLIVEDSLTQRLRLQWLLEKGGYTVEAAKDGAAALAILETRRPALVISDIRMPGIDGFELCRRIRRGRHGAALPLLLMTALSSPHDLLQVLKCGADNIVVKPYNEKLLLRQIAAVLRTRELLDARTLEQTSPGGSTYPIHFAGEDHTVTVQPEQLLSLLLSTYESAVQTSRDLFHKQEELKSTQIQLREMERRAKERLKPEQPVPAEDSAVPHEAAAAEAAVFPPAL